MQVEVPSQGLGDGEGEGPEDEEMQFHVEMEATGDAPLISDTLTAVLSRRPVMASDMAEKLDIMMSICFEHFYSLCHSNGIKLCGRGGRHVASFKIKFPLSDTQVY